MTSPVFRPAVPALSLVLLAAGCGEQAAFQAPPPPVVTVAPPMVQEVTTFKEFTGRLDAEDTVQIRARVQGYLRSVEFEPGDTVSGPDGQEPGQLLFTIEPEPFEAALAAAEAALAQATASRDLAQVRRDRTQQAAERGAASDLELIERQAELDGAEAAVLAAEARVRQAKIDLAYTRVHTPIEGRVSREMVDVGNLVGGAEPTLLTTVIDDDPMFAYADVAERELLDFVDGQGTRPKRRDEAKSKDIFLETADGERFENTGKFNFAETRLDPTTGTLQIRAAFPNPKGTLYPGMFVRLLVPDLTGQQTLVPDTAIQRDLAGPFVYVVNTENTVERRPVTLSQAAGDMRIVTEGLSPEDSVIVNGIQRAYPGAKVDPRQAQPQPPSEAEPAPEPTPESASESASEPAETDTPAGEG